MIAYEVVFKVLCVTLFFIVIIFAAACKKHTISSNILNLKGKEKTAIPACKEKH